MTLFLKITRDYIQKQISHTNSASSDKDDGYEGYVRNEPLSAAKQATFQTLSDELDNIGDEFGADEEIKAHIERLVEQCQDGIRADISSNDGGNGGRSQDLLNKIETGFRAFYKNCRKLELLNQTYDATNPVHIVQRILLTYLTERDKIKDALRERKKEACEETILALKQNIRDLSPAEAMPIVRQELQRLEEKKTLLCQQYANKFEYKGWALSIPSFIGSKARRSVALEKALMTATKQLNLLQLDPPVEIASEKPSKKPSKSSTAATLRRLTEEQREQLEESDEESLMISSDGEQEERLDRHTHQKAATSNQDRLMTSADLTRFGINDDQDRESAEEDNYEDDAFEDESPAISQRAITRSQSSKKTSNEVSMNPFDLII